MQNKRVKILSRLKKESKELSKITRILKGTVSKIYVTCGNKNCKCYKGAKHESFILTYKGDKNITKTLYIRKNKISHVKNFIANYNKVKDSLDKMLLLNIDLLKWEK